MGAPRRPGGAGRAGGPRGRHPGVAAGPRDRDRLAGLAGRQRERARLRHAGRPQPGLGRPRLDRPARAHPVPGRLHLPGGGRPPVGEALAFVLRRGAPRRSGWPATPAAARSAGRPDPGPAGAAGLLGRRQGPLLRRQAAGRRPPARGLLAGRAEAPGPGLDGRAGHPGRRRPPRPGRHPDRRRHRQRLRRPPGRPVGAGRRAGPAAAAVGVGRPAPSAGSTPARCWWSRAAATGRSTCGWWT